MLRRREAGAGAIRWKMSDTMDERMDKKGINERDRYAQGYTTGIDVKE